MIIPQQKDIVEVNFKLPGGKFEPHPALVISNNTVNEYEDTFLAVMITSSTEYDEYSILIDNKMLSKPMRNKSQIRCHLMQSFNFEEINLKIASFKKDYFDKILKKILKLNY